MSDVKKDIMINRLVEMGFNREEVESALSNAGCRGEEAALDWLISNAGKCILPSYSSIWYFHRLAVRGRKDLRL